MQSETGHNYFELFGIPVSFDIDTVALTGRYRELQRRFHPDRFANATDRERRLSIQQASTINEAFQTLKSPLLRARYLLGLHGLEVDDQSNTVMDSAFLVQQMEYREALEDIGTSKSHDQLVAFIAQVTAQRNDLVKRLSNLLVTPDQEQLIEAHKLTLQMQFLDKLLGEAEALEETIL